MEPWILALLGGGLAAGLAALAATPGRIIADQRAQIAHERDERQRLEAELAALRPLRAQLAEMVRHQGKLVRAGELFADHGWLGEALDFAQCGVVFSLVDNGGTWVWVNRSFFEALGYRGEEGRLEVLRLGWRALIHPDDLRPSQSAEGAAWADEVEVVNRYRRLDGGWVRCRWKCPRYRRGGTVCIVRLEVL